jgi:hypothetical protein
MVRKDMTRLGKARQVESRARIKSKKSGAQHRTSHQEVSAAVEDSVAHS